MDNKRTEDEVYRQKLRDWSKMNETSLCAIKEGMFLSVFDENWQFLIRMGMIIEFYAMAVIKKEENEQSQFLMNRK